MDIYNISEKPLEHIDVMTCLIGQDSSVIGPGTAPGVLIIIALISAPAHPHRSQDQTTQPPGLQSSPSLDHRDFETVLLYHEQLDTRRIAGADHFVRVP